MSRFRWAFIWAACMVFVTISAVRPAHADWRDVPDAGPGHCVNCPDSGSSRGDSGGSRSSYDPDYEAYYQSYSTAVTLQNQAIKLPAREAIEKYYQVLEYIEGALRYRPNDSKVLNLKHKVQASMKCCDGQIAVDNGDFDGALRLFDEAQQIYPESSDLWQRNREWAYQNEYSKARDLMNEKRWSEAELHFRRLAPRYKGYFSYFYLGYVLNKQGKLSDAEWSYRQAIALDPESVASYCNLADILDNQKRYAEAEAAYRQALKLAPDDADTVNNLGVVLEKQGRFEEAKASYQKALEIDPKVGYAADNLKSVEGEIKKQVEAKQDAKVVPGIQENIDALITEMDKKAAPGRPQSVYRTVNGKQVEFTVEPHPQDGPKAAGDQLKSVTAAGQSAAGASRSETSADRSQLGFDTPAAPAGKLPVLVTGGHSSGSGSTTVPEAYRKDPEILKYQQEKKDLDKKYDDLGVQLKSLNSKMEKGEGDKGELQVQAADVLDQMTAVRSEKATTDIHIQDRVRKLSFPGVDLTAKPSRNKTKKPAKTVHEVE